MFTFSEKPNGISMILEPFWSLFGRYERTNERTEDRAAQPAPPSRRTILSPWTGSAPPLQYGDSVRISSRIPVLIPAPSQRWGGGANPSPPPPVPTGKTKRFRQVTDPQAEP